MRLVSYVNVSAPMRMPPPIQIGLLEGGLVIDLQAAHNWAGETHEHKGNVIPGSMQELLMNWGEAESQTSDILTAMADENPVALRTEDREPVATSIGNVRLLAPLPRPLSFRDFYAFEEHVKNGMALRGRDVRPQWYEMPVFYFSNVNSFYGPDEPVPRPSYTLWLDYELEIACVIGKTGINIPAEEAAGHIAGYAILNDWSARDVQLKEMQVGLGPAKGKDFATSLGPAIVTPDEIADKQVGDGAELRYDLEMVARVNGEERSRGNFKDIYWTFAQIIEHASKDVYLYPGEVIGSGTVGSGSLLEQNAEATGEWLKPGDVVELEIEGLGVLRNPIANPEDGP